MSTLRKLLTLTITFALSACVNVAQDFKFQPDGTTGLAIGSVSYESGLGKYFLVTQNVETQKVYEFGFGCPVFPCLESANDDAYSTNEQPKQRGGGYAVEVPAGRYRIIGWHVVQGYKNSRSFHPADIPFTVQRGEASYLGNLHFDADWEAVQLRDKSTRDLPLLQAKFLLLKSTPMAYTIAPDMRVERLGGEYQSRIEGFVFIPMLPLRR